MENIPVSYGSIADLFHPRYLKFERGQAEYSVSTCKAKGGAMKRLILHSILSVVFCGFHLKPVDAHAVDKSLTDRQSYDSSVRISASETYVWDFSLTPTVLPGKKGSIWIQAWSETEGVTSSTFRFYLSKDFNLNVKKDKLIGALQVNLTGPSSGDESDNFYSTFKIPPTTKPGNYFFFLTVDGRKTTLRGEYFYQILKIKKK